MSNNTNWAGKTIETKGSSSSKDKDTKPTSPNKRQWFGSQFTQTSGSKETGSSTKTSDQKTQTGTTAQDRKDKPVPPIPGVIKK